MFLGSMFRPFSLILLIRAVAYAEDQAPPPSEYQMKAAFLFNFAKFVEWPVMVFKSPDQPIAICTLDENPFGSSLDDITRDKTVGNRKFAIRKVSNIEEVSKCHILFVGASQLKVFRSFPGNLTRFAILTVGEDEDFIANGGIVNLKLKDARIQIEIDIGGAERAHLRISSKLLSLAKTTQR